MTGKISLCRHHDSAITAVNWIKEHVLPQLKLKSEVFDINIDRGRVGEKFDVTSIANITSEKPE